jgi:excisionase family DNA binding protein
MMSIYDEMARMETARRKANSRLSRRERIEEELDQWEYTVPEAAEVLGEHPKTIYRRIKNREIKATKRSPRKTRILSTDLAAYIVQESGKKISIIFRR